MLDPFLSQFRLSTSLFPGSIGGGSPVITVDPLPVVNAIGNLTASSFMYQIVDGLCFFHAYLDAAGATTGSGALVIDLPVKPAAFASNVRFPGEGLVRLGSSPHYKAWGVFLEDEINMSIYRLSSGTANGTAVYVPGITAINVNDFTHGNGNLTIGGWYEIA